MKNCAELSYILENEPCAFFSNVETKSRTVYIWENKRSHVEMSGEINSWTRVSEMHEQPNNAFMEIWKDTDLGIPIIVDDKWTETYKTVAQDDCVLEWHPDTSLFRIVWFQNIKSLKETKLLGRMVTLLSELGLEIPIFPTILD